MSDLLKAKILEAVRKLDAIDERDPEDAHSTADRVLLDCLKELGAAEVEDAYDRLVDRCRWWACA